MKHLACRAALAPHVHRPMAKEFRKGGHHTALRHTISVDRRALADAASCGSSPHSGGMQSSHSQRRPLNLAACAELKHLRPNRATEG
eukprot:4532647-Pleurochrysis_carterae.AAC.2